MGKIDDSQTLAELYPAAGARALAKEVAEIDRHCARFIELSPFCVFGSSSTDSQPDLSPRGGAPGFARVRDPHTILIPDRPGNNRLDSLKHFADNPSIALLFLIPGIDETLRVYGTVEIVSGAEFQGQFASNDKEPRTVLKIKVKRAFFQCAKALMRAQLWKEEAKVDRSSLPPLSEIIKDQIKVLELANAPIESREAMLRRYAKEL
jgi:PPOX class probable FMN-dependent enzyme